MRLLALIWRTLNDSGHNVNVALDHLATAGHLHVVDDEFDAYKQVLAAWWQAHQAGLDHPMVDRRNSVRRALNRLAHALRRANRELSADHILGEGRQFATGDRVIALRADLLVERGGRRYVAEVKTGEAAPSLATAATRRQLLEYLIAYRVDGVLLVDAERGSVHEVEFPGAGAL